MRYPAAEKLEIIRLVEQSALTGAANIGQNRSQTGQNEGIAVLFGAGM